MRSVSQKTHRGRCLCGLAKYQVQGAAEIVAHCHCENCQRLTGSGHTTGAIFPVDKFQITGEVAEYKYQSDQGNTVTRIFCPSCGSPIYGRNTGMEGFLTITLGTFEDSSEFTPTVVVFARNRKSWDVMDKELPTFDGQPSWIPRDTTEQELVQK